MNILFTSYAQGSLGVKANNIYFPMCEILNERLKNNNYGSGLKEWFLMFVIIGPKSIGYGAKERKLYKSKSKEIDLRLDVDFEAFRRGNSVDRTFLLYKCMKRSLDIIASKKIQDFDIDSLKSDFESIAEEYDWNKSPAS